MYGTPTACGRVGSSLRPRGARAFRGLEGPGGGKRRDTAERRPERTNAGNCWGPPRRALRRRKRERLGRCAHAGAWGRRRPAPRAPRPAPCPRRPSPRDRRLGLEFGGAFACLVERRRRRVAVSGRAGRARAAAGRSRRARRPRSCRRRAAARRQPGDQQADRRPGRIDPAQLERPPDDLAEPPGRRILASGGPLGRADASGGRRRGCCGVGHGPGSWAGGQW